MKFIIDSVLFFNEATQVQREDFNAILSRCNEKVIMFEYGLLRLTTLALMETLQLRHTDIDN